MKVLRLLLGAALLIPSSAAAAPILTFGAGSTVTTVYASANFETFNALNDNPYVEGGLSFSRTGLSFDNNGCGFQGCAGHPGFIGFTGNYLYGVGNDGYFTIRAASDEFFTGLEFLSGTGFSGSEFEILTWSAYRLGTLVGNGTAVVSGVVTIGFADAAGFDRLQYTREVVDVTHAPALDSVKAQYLPRTTQVPEPSSLLMFSTSLGAGLVGALRRRFRQKRADA